MWHCWEEGTHGDTRSEPSNRRQTGWQVPALPSNPSPGHHALPGSPAVLPCPCSSVAAPRPAASSDAPSALGSSRPSSTMRAFPGVHLHSSSPCALEWLPGASWPSADVLFVDVHPSIKTSHIPDTEVTALLFSFRTCLENITPRCGVPDLPVLPDGQNGRNRQKRFVLSGGRWDKTDLTSGPSSLRVSALMEFVCCSVAWKRVLEWSFSGLEML